MALTYLSGKLIDNCLLIFESSHFVTVWSSEATSAFVHGRSSILGYPNSPTYERISIIGRLLRKNGSGWAIRVARSKLVGLSVHSTNLNVSVVAITDTKWPATGFEAIKTKNDFNGLWPNTGAIIYVIDLSNLSNLI